MDSTSFAHSFSFRSIRKEWNTLNMNKLTINKREHHQELKATRIPTGAAKPLIFP